MLLDELEDKSIYILREAFSKFERLTMLWSVGKNSTVLLWLAREAFFGHAPFALANVDQLPHQKALLQPARPIPVIGP